MEGFGLRGSFKILQGVLERSDGGTMMEKLNRSKTVRSGFAIRSPEYVGTDSDFATEMAFIVRTIGDLIDQIRASEGAVGEPDTSRMPVLKDTAATIAFLEQVSLRASALNPESIRFPDDLYKQALEGECNLCRDASAGLLLAVSGWQQRRDQSRMKKARASEVALSAYLGEGVAVRQAAESSVLAFQAQLNRKQGGPIDPAHCLRVLATPVAAPARTALPSPPVTNFPMLLSPLQSPGAEPASPDAVGPLNARFTDLSVEIPETPPHRQSAGDPLSSPYSPLLVPPPTAPPHFRQSKTVSMPNIASPGDVQASIEWPLDFVGDPKAPLAAKLSQIELKDVEIIKPISKGGYAKVFLATFRPEFREASSTPEVFAVKVMSKKEIVRRNLVSRVLAEHTIMARTQSPYLVQFYCSFQSPDNLYLVMEYLPGGDLFSLIQSVGALSEEAARQYIGEVILALRYLHSQGVIHRDIKPDNILIAANGHVRLTDFGLSSDGLSTKQQDMEKEEKRQLSTSLNFDSPRPKSRSVETVGIHSASGRPRRTMNERIRERCIEGSNPTIQFMVPGTPDYIAPEVLRGEEHTVAVDWWSLGVLLFELICGYPPFASESLFATFRNICLRKMEWSDMSDNARDLIDSLLQSDPQKRLGSRQVEDILHHPFFEGVDWDQLTSQAPPFLPQLDDEWDTSYFAAREGVHPTERDSFMRPVVLDIKGIGKA